MTRTLYLYFIELLSIGCTGRVVSLNEITIAVEVNHEGIDK
jgi:hypothetical protein